MKAVQFTQHGGPEVLQVYDAPDPIPGPQDVLIQVKATTVNHLDLFQRAGSRPIAGQSANCHLRLDWKPQAWYSSTTRAFVPVSGF